MGLLRLFGVVAGETTGSTSLRLIFDFLAESTPVLDDFKLITIVPLGAYYAGINCFSGRGSPTPTTPLMVVKEILVPHMLCIKKNVLSAHFLRTGAGFLTIFYLEGYNSRRIGLPADRTPCNHWTS